MRLTSIIKVGRRRRACEASSANSSRTRASLPRLARACAALLLAAIPFALYFAPSSAQTPTPAPAARRAQPPSPQPSLQPTVETLRDPQTTGTNASGTTTNATTTNGTTTNGTSTNGAAGTTTATTNTTTNGGGTQAGAANGASANNNGASANNGAQASQLPAACVTDVYQFGGGPEPTPSPTPASATPSPTQPPACFKAPTGGGVERKGGLNDIIVVKVYRLSALLDEANCTNHKTTPCAPKDILLFINGRPLKGLRPESGAPELAPDGSGTLHYHLLRSPAGSDVTPADASDLKEHWDDLLGMDFSADGLSLTRPVSVSVGFDRDAPILSPPNNFSLVRLRLLRLLWWIAAFLLCVYVFFRLARRTDLIRDRRPVAWQDVQGRLTPPQKSYSLSQSQAAWWFFFVIIAFVFIWLVTGQYDLSTQALILIGIGFGTAIGSTVIDQNRQQTSATGNNAPPNDAELSGLLQQKASLEEELATDYNSLSDAKKKNDQAGIEAAQAKINTAKASYTTTINSIRSKYPNALGWGHQGYFTDIVSDSIGVSFHRFQIVVWTIVLGFIFIHDVLSRLSMPEFSNTLLSLMGISNGAYLIGKSTEQQTAPISPTSATPPGGGVADAGHTGQNQ